MFISPAFAQGAGGAAAGPDFSFLFLMLALFAIMYFLIIRPQNKRMKEHRQMVAALRRGDEIITQGGVYAKVTRVKEGDVEIEAEIAKVGGEPVKIRIVRDTISSVVSKTEPAGSESGKSQKPANANKPKTDKSAKSDEKS